MSLFIMPLSSVCAVFVPVFFTMYVCCTCIYVIVYTHTVMFMYGLLCRCNLPAYSACILYLHSVLVYFVSLISLSTENCHLNTL